MDRNDRAGPPPGETVRRGWKDILRRVWKEIGRDNLSMVAAGVGFYAFMGIFPALAAAAALYGLIADPYQVERLIATLNDVVPADVLTLINRQMHALIGSSPRSLGLALAVSLALALWSATKGVKAMMTALDIAYEENERRGWIRLNAVALGLTFFGIVFALLALALLAALPLALWRLGVPPGLRELLDLLRWPILALAVMTAAAVLYWLGPDRRPPHWQWLTWGAAVATAIWILASVGFTLYVANFGNYNKTYGTLASVVILLLWLYISAYALLLGAEFNSELEQEHADLKREGQAAMMQPSAGQRARLG